MAIGWALLFRLAVLMPERLRDPDGGWPMPGMQINAVLMMLNLLPCRPSTAGASR